jgi:hypothetical protein
MSLVKLSNIFDVRYGHSLELNALDQTTIEHGIAFVSRQMGRNGVSAYVKPVEDHEPAPPGDISCALGGNGVLTTCLQEQQFYCGRDVAILRPKMKLTKQEILYLCLCIKSNRFRYNYGRQANKTLRDLKLPSLNEVKKQVSGVSIPKKPAKNSSITKRIQLPPENKWKLFKLKDLFSITGSKTTSLEELKSHGSGEYPYVTTQATNNGVAGYYNFETESGGVITIDSAVSGFAAYQEHNFSASDHVEKLVPKFNMNLNIAMFFVVLLNTEQYRYNYGRKASQTRLKQLSIKLPVDKDGKPNYSLMESYMRSLPYSSNL